MTTTCRALLSVLCLSWPALEANRAVGASDTSASCARTEFGRTGSVVDRMRVESPKSIRTEGSRSVSDQNEDKLWLNSRAYGFVRLVLYVIYCTVRRYQMD